MPFQPGKPRSSSVLASVLAAAGIVLTMASCSHLTPLGPDAPPQPRHLGSPIVPEAMRVQAPTATGRCPAGFTTLSGPVPDPSLCYRPLGAPVTITSAAVAAPVVSPASPPPGQPASYGITVAVPAADVAAVTAVITQAYDSRGAIDISVAGKTWAAPEVTKPFPGRQFQIVLPSMTQFLQLQRILVPPG